MALLATLGGCRIFMKLSNEFELFNELKSLKLNHITIPMKYFCKTYSCFV